jgi:uncharacterized protein involved in exopolysaccharide biosynthesis
MTTETLFSNPNKPGEAAPPVSSEAGAAAGAEDVSLLDLLIAVAERKRIVFFTTFAVTALAGVMSFLLPVRYTANITLLPPQQNTSMGSALASQLGNLGGMAALTGGSIGLKSPNDMFVGMLRSRTVEEAVVQQFGLMSEYHQRYLSDACKTFEKNSTIDAAGKDGFIHIFVEDRDPKRAAEIANGYVEKFRSLSQNLAITEAAQRRLFFQKELEQSKDNLASSEEALKQTEQSTGVIALDSQARALIESASSLRAQISAREVQIQGMQTYATGENSQLLQAQRELESLRAQLAKLGGSEDSAGELMVPKGRVPEAALEYARRLRDVKYNETVFDILARQFEVAKLDEAKEGSLIQVVDPAVIPERRSAPKRTLIVLGAIFAGFVLGIFAALLRSWWTRMELDPDFTAKMEHLRWSMIGRKS